jgi:predicted HTH domain antitoxin
MAPIELHLPAELVALAKLDRGDISQEAAKLIALQLFREEIVSLGKAAQLCGTPIEAFMEFLASHNVPPHYA